MPFSSIALLVGICLMWSGNVILGKVMVSTYGIPPLWFVAARFALVAVLLFRLLWPVPAKLPTLVAVALLMGGAHFGLMFLALDQIDASLAAVIILVGVPISAGLSCVVLGERPSAQRLLGIALACVGALIVLWGPVTMGNGIGIILMLGSVVALSFGSVLLKTLPAITPLQVQAWVAAASAPPLLLLSCLLENDQITASVQAIGPFLGTVFFSAVVVTIIAHTLYFRLLQRHDITQVTPFTLLVPLMTASMGALWLDEALPPQLWIGAVTLLAGIWLINTRDRKQAGMHERQVQAVGNPTPR